MMSLSNAIRMMLLGGVLAIAFISVKACQPAPSQIDSYAVDSLRRLTVLDRPPAQPRLTFETPDGTVQLSDYRGQVVLVNIWATWCAPCIAEMPSLDQLQAERGSADFAVVPISLDRTMEEAALWYERNGITALPLIHDGTFRVNSVLELPGLPTSILYDRAGNEVARLPGEAEWDSDEALALIDYLTGRSAALPIPAPPSDRGE